MPRNHQWLATVTTEGGRHAYLGFHGVWYGQRHDQEYKAAKAFAVTDRPVYRPGQEVNYKVWLRHAQYDQEDVSQFANRKVKVQMHDPKGEKILDKHFTADEFGGFEFKHLLPDAATLGAYRVQVNGFNLGGANSFRVEEYKKPEFEVVIDAPTEPVMLGEEIEATINAKYLFGAPVANAKVKYKVLRTAHNQRWYPSMPWDWFYGPGYWWFAYDYEWYPGWYRWGCKRPHYWWVPPWPRAAGGRLRRGSRDRRRRHRESEDRHLFGQGRTRRHRPPLRDLGRGHRRVAPHDLRKGIRPRGAQAFQSHFVDGPRILPRRRRAASEWLSTHFGWKTSQGGRQADALLHQLRRRIQTGRESGHQLGDRHRCGGLFQAADQGLEEGTVPRVLPADRQEGSYYRGADMCSSCAEMASMARTFVSASWSW